MSVWKGLIVMIGAAAVLGCGVGFNEATGGDGTRGEAREIPTNATLDDRVSAEQGDNSDWKRFTVDGTRRLSVQVWWDNPAVSGRVSLRDELGKELTSVKHKSGERTDTLGPIEIQAGIYYVEFTVTSGDSVYTYELRTAQTGPILPDL